MISSISRDGGHALLGGALFTAATYFFNRRISWPMLPMAAAGAVAAIALSRFQRREQAATPPAAAAAEPAVTAVSDRHEATALTVENCEGQLSNWPIVRALREPRPLPLQAKDFLERGGTLLNLDLASQKVQLPNKPWYPVCEAGCNRSQLAYQHLQTLDTAQTRAPHGAIEGMDPFMHHKAGEGELELDGETLVTAYNWSAVPENGADQVLTRVARFGEAENPTWGPTSAVSDLYGQRNADGFPIRQQMRTWMDENYYKPIIKDGGTLIVFNKALHVMLMRLLENGTDMSRVTLIAIEADDPVTSSGSATAIETFRANLQQALHQ